MALPPRARRLFRRIPVAMGGLLLALGVFFTQTPWGRGLALRAILAKVEGAIAGTIEVESVSSSGLLRGLTLRGVRILGEDGRAFLEADSVMAGLSPRTLLNGDLFLTRAAVWSPVIRLERLPHQGRMNAAAIFSPEPGRGPEGEEPRDASPEAEPPSAASTEAPGGDSLAPAEAREADSQASTEAPEADSLQVPAEGSVPVEEGRTIAVRGLRIHDGTLHILRPVPPGRSPGPRALVEPAPDGASELRRMSFRQIELEISTGVIRSPDAPGERFTVEDLAFVGEVWPEPIRVDGLRGEFTRETGRLLAELEEVRLPSSLAQGHLEVGWGGEDGAWVTVEGQAEGLALGDLHPIEPRLPDGVARGTFRLRFDSRGTLLGFDGTRLAMADGSLQARGGLLLGRPLEMRSLNLTMDQVPLEVLDPWLPRPSPLHGSLAGDLNLSGTSSDLTVDADVTLRGPEDSGVVTAEFSGAFQLGEELGIRDLMATVAPLEWSMFAGLSPAMTLQGPGALRFEADGSLPAGIRITAEATHVPAGVAPSRVTATGSVQRVREDLFLSLRGELDPLSLTTLGQYFPEMPLTGEVSGPVALRGGLSDLSLEAELLTPAGPFSFEARFDARNPAARYSVDSEFQEFLVSSLVPSLPDPTRITGRLLASGKGFVPDSIGGEATLFLRRAEIGFLHADTAALVARVEEGVLRLDTLIADTEVGRIDAGGYFGVSSTAPPGELNVQIESESVTGLRPLLMGEVPFILDDLNRYDLDFLRRRGEDPDTIPTAEEVAVEGRVQARAVLRGGWNRFTAEGSLAVQGMRYRADYLDGATLTFSARDLPGEDWRVEGLLLADSMTIKNRSFREGEVEGEVGRADGRVRIFAAREGEEYRARGTYALEDGGGSVNLDDLDIRFDSIRWNLGGPAVLTWGSDGVSVRDFRLIRPGLGNMRIEANGSLPVRGEADFDLRIQELHLQRLARIAQLEETLEGTLNLQARVTGTAEDPVMEATFAGEGLRAGPFTLSGLESRFTYRDLRVEGEAWASEGGRQVLAVEGFFPTDLRIGAEGPRIPEGPVDLTVVVDSFPAALALIVVDGLEEVEGTLSGEVHLGGTPGELAPEGRIRLREGHTFIPALGIRYRGVESTFGLRPDGTVEVDGRFLSRGEARVTGTVLLHPLTNPGLDLSVEATDLLATSRRDVQAHVSGQLQVTQTYRRPRVEGALTVEEGVLQVDELARSVEVMDLSDPIFTDVIEEESSLRPIVEANQNPFLQNLMLAVDLSLSRGGWLRGRDLNVEMAGNVSVFWDRTERDLALVGDLQAVRGVYTVLGRQFQVQGGRVSFLGTPGIDPNLNIEALHRLRTAGGERERLDITATVTGTLLSPRVTLSSDEAYGLAESDLVSYLIFGRPSYALVSGQNRWVQGAAGSLLGAAGGAGLNFTLGTVGSQLSSVVARDFGLGLDYLAISQGEYVDPFGLKDLSGTVATTQVEIGQYLTDDIFAVLMWRPLNSLGGASSSQFAGLRVEWSLTDLWTLDGFIEDRFSRSPIFASGDLFRVKKTMGFFFWREWGY